jgi:hypothetical protein
VHTLGHGMNSECPWRAQTNTRTDSGVMRTEEDASDRHQSPESRNIECVSAWTAEFKDPTWPPRPKRR